MELSWPWNTANYAQISTMKKIPSGRKIYFDWFQRNFKLKQINSFFSLWDKRPKFGLIMT